MKKVLLVDTNLAALPIYKYLKSLGYTVYVVGGNPSDFLAKYADNYININYSIVNELIKVIKKYKIDFLVPGCNDLSYKICATINEKIPFFGISPLQTSEIINDKKLFRELSAKHKLSSPRLLDINNYKTCKKIIVKPTDSFSGRGVSVVDSEKTNDVNSAIENAILNSKNKSYVLEEYVEGQLYSYSAFIKNKIVFVDFVVEEYCKVNPFAVDTSWVVPKFNVSIKKKLKKEIELISKALNLCDGLMHAQFILNKDKFWILELTRRCPGDLYSELIELTTGFGYAENYTKPFINKGYKNNKDISLNNNFVRQTISSDSETVLENLFFSKSVCGIKYYQTLQVGDVLKQSPNGKVGIVFYQCKSNKKDKNILINGI